KKPALLRRRGPRARAARTHGPLRFVELQGFFRGGEKAFGPAAAQMIECDAIAAMEAVRGIDEVFVAQDVKRGAIDRSCLLVAPPPERPEHRRGPRLQRETAGNSPHVFEIALARGHRLLDDA